MQDFFNFVMLVCAALAAMGLGVWVAYGIFRAGFALMRWHSEQNAPAVAVAVKPSTEAAGLS
jgi:hypothetical protein